MLSKTVLSVSALAFAAGSSAHLVMNTPTPYNEHSVQVNPLDGEEYLFPCQKGSVETYDADGVYNPMPAGSDNSLKFTGSAVHGGGSCQVSVTYDWPPPEDRTRWKVIHSFIGGCPVVSEGNLESISTDADQRPTGRQCKSSNEKECLRQLDFKMPEGMKNGNGTLAWTWFNKMGNREFYMNCAPVSISGGSDDDTYFNTLPDMAVANIPGHCKYGPSSAVVGFEDPGKFVTNGEEVTEGYEDGCKKSPGSVGGDSDDSDDSSPSAAPSSYAAPSSTAASSYAAPSSYEAPSSAAGGSYEAPSAPAGSYDDGSYKPGSYGAPALPSVSLTFKAEGNRVTSYVQASTLATQTPSQSAVASSPAVSSAPAAYPVVAASGSASINNTGACEEGKVSCPSPGNIMCIGDNQFGLCNIDYCAAPEDLSKGTTCTSGVISKRDITRRSTHFHRHAHNHKL